MKFSKHSEDGTKIEMEISEHASLNEVFEEFQRFLRACGYVIKYNKVLDLVDVDE